MSVPVKVSGQSVSGPFSEDTHTMAINAHGALITLAARVAQGAEVELKSHTHPESQKCRVVFVGPSAEGKTQFGVEFSRPAPNFWHVAFPPEDWAPFAEEAPVKQSKA